MRTASNSSGDGCCVRRTASEKRSFVKDKVHSRFPECWIVVITEVARYVRLKLHPSVQLVNPDNVNDHRAAAIDLQAEKAARPAAPCASYCYHAIIEDQALPSAIHSTDVPVGHHQVCETTLLVWRLGAKPLVRTRYLTRIVDTEIWV